MLTRIKRRFGRIVVPSWETLRAARQRRNELIRDVKRLRRRRDQVVGTIARLENRSARVQAQCDILARDLTPPAHRDREEQLDVELDRGRPGYAEPLRTQRRGRATGLDQAEGFDEPIFTFNSKLASLEFAAAHGIRTPKHEGPWATPDLIPFEEFGDRLVIKCTHGFGARGVYPLVRQENVYFDNISKQLLTRDEVVHALLRRHRADAGYYVEEFIASPDDPTRQANDVKVYGFYGKITHVEVWRDKWTRYDGGRHGRVRAFHPDGTPMGHPRPFVDDGVDLPPPADFAGLVDQCTRLSAAIRRSYARFDFFESDQGWVFAELAKNPSATPILNIAMDTEFGLVLEDAHVRLLRDLVADGAFGSTPGARHS